MMSLLYSILSKEQNWQFDAENNQMIFQCPDVYQDWQNSTFVFLDLLHLKPYTYQNRLALTQNEYNQFIKQSKRLKFLRSLPNELRYLYQLNYWKSVSNQSFMAINLSDLTDNSLQKLKNYFDEHHIAHTQKNKQIHISKYDYVHLYKNLDGFKALIPAICYKTDTIIPFTAKEWQHHFKQTKLFGRLFSDSAYYKQTLYQSTVDHPINMFILRNNQFLTLLKQDELKTTNMYVDSSTDTNKRLDEIDALGLYSWPGDFINLHTKTLHSYNFISTLLHEINHRTQFLSDLEYKSFAINQVMEASSTAVSIINETNPPYDKIYDDCFDFIEQNLDKNTYKKYLLNTSLPEQRLYSLDYLIKAEAELKMHQCITEMYLAKDRSSLYDVLIKHQISLNSQDFNDLCEDIDYWKNYNLNHYLTLSKEEKYPNENNAILQEIFNLNIHTSPTALFTVDELKQLGFDTQNTAPAPLPLKYIYQGVTSELLEEATTDLNQGNVNALNKKLVTLQKINPILQGIYWENGDFEAKDILSILKSMAENKPISNILSQLNFNMTDKSKSIQSAQNKVIQIRGQRQR